MSTLEKAARSALALLERVERDGDGTDFTFQFRVAAEELRRALTLIELEPAPVRVSREYAEYHALHQRSGRFSDPIAPAMWESMSDVSKIGQVELLMADVIDFESRAAVIARETAEEAARKASGMGTW